MNRKKQRILNRNPSPSDVPESRPIPYGRQQIDEEDIDAVLSVLRSDWLTTGPRVAAFEEKLAETCGARYAVAVNSGTAALHSAMFAAGIGSGDEVLVPAITFAATANSVVYQGATPVFVDVAPETLLIDPRNAASKITPRTRAIISVDYAGQPCNYDALKKLASRHNLLLIADACHSLGARYRGNRVGSLAHLNAFSFHPVKQITTGEGGAITTDDAQMAERMRQFRNHGISSDHHQRAAAGAYEYDMTSLGFNYRLSDLQCALGISQLRKLPGWIARRRRIVALYDSALFGMSEIQPLKTAPHVDHAHHLYVIRINGDEPGHTRNRVFEAMRRAGIGVNVHYRPVHLHSFYRERFRTREGQCPIAEALYQRILTLPIYPAMSNHDIKRVTGTLSEALNAESMNEIEVG